MVDRSSSWIYIYMYVDVVERRVCWIREENVMDRCNWSLFVILPIVDYYRRYVDFFFLTELIRGSIIRFRVFFENDLFRGGNFRSV